MSESHEHIHDDALRVQLTALADGSLDPGRAAVLEARAAESPELSAALARQRNAVALLREVVAATEAPLALRERIERDRAQLAAPAAGAAARGSSPPPAGSLPWRWPP